MVFVLETEGFEAYRPTLVRVVVPVALLNSLFIGVAVGVEKGYKRGLLFALAFLVILLLYVSAAKLGIDLCIICMF